MDPYQTPETTSSLKTVRGNQCPYCKTELTSKMIKFSMLRNVVICKNCDHVLLYKFMKAITFPADAILLILVIFLSLYGLGLALEYTPIILILVVLVISIFYYLLKRLNKILLIKYCKIKTFE